uniref:type I protein arginine methyltransferase n=1 Tax=Plectus sambesii TaxID=2011161 RepID=A0A914XD13_9BILA
MFPSVVKLFTAPFADSSLVNEWQTSYTDIWTQTVFHGIDLSSMFKPALDQQMSRPIVDTYLPNIIVAPTSTLAFSFTEKNEEDLNELTIPVDVKPSRTASVNGFTLWFDLDLVGSEQTITLSTSPFAPQTTVWQVRTLFKQPLLVEVGQRINGTVVLRANKKGTYDIVIDISAPAGRRQESYDMSDKAGRKVQLMQGPMVGFIPQSPTDHIFNSEWRPPLLTEAQQQQQQQRMHAEAQSQPLIRHIYDRIIYYYHYFRFHYVGRVTGSSLF